MPWLFSIHHGQHFSEENREVDGEVERKEVGQEETWERRIFALTKHQSGAGSGDMGAGKQALRAWK